MDQPDNDSHAPSFWRRPAGMALATAAVIAGFYLLREHWGCWRRFKIEPPGVRQKTWTG